MRVRMVSDDGLVVQNTEDTQKKGQGRRRMDNDRGRGVRISLDYEIEVRDKAGKVLSRERGRGDPFTRSYLRFLRTMFSCAVSNAQVTVTLLDTSDVSSSFGASTQIGYGLTPMAVNAGATSDVAGIQVGTSDVAFDRGQNKLLAKILHGSGAGQLSYGASTVEDYADEDSTTRFRIIRTFTNLSGSPVTVKEIGIVMANYNQNVGAWKYLLIARDVLASPQTVPDGATLTVRYRAFISYA